MWPTFREILDKSETKNLKIDQLFAGSIKIHLYLRCSLPLCKSCCVYCRRRLTGSETQYSTLVTSFSYLIKGNDLVSKGNSRQRITAMAR
jgi:hypothetical protein